MNEEYEWRMSCAILRKRIKKGEKKVIKIKGKVFWRACHSLHPRIFNGLKIAVLIGLITNW